METIDNRNDNQISDEAVNNIGAASGWMIASSVLLFLSAFFTLIAAMQYISFFPLLGFLYLIIAGGMGYMGFILIMQGIAANKFKLTKNSTDFDSFASNLKKYWMFVIIFTIVMILLLIVISQNPPRGLRF